MLPVEISDGWVRLGAVAYNNLVRLPLQASGGIRIWLQLNTADVVQLTGSAVRIETIEEARYVEELPADLRPQDPARIAPNLTTGGVRDTHLEWPRAGDRRLSQVRDRLNLSRPV
jgi:hypothetical protein